MPSSTILALAIMTAPLAPPAATIRQRPSLPATGPAAMDIAGVRLGMLPADVRAALARAGYRIDRSDETADFDQEVSSELNFRLKGVGRMDGKPRGVSRIVATGPNREYLTIDFAQWPAGSVVDVISLSIPEERQTAAAFREQVIGRYGKATLLPNSCEPKWCTSGDRDCTVASSPALPNLAASFYSRSLWLRYGETADRERRVSLKAAADAKVPPAAKSAF